MKTCTGCKGTKNKDAFYPTECYGSSSDYYCIECRLASTAASRRRRALRGPPCDNCGEKYVYYAKGLCSACYVYKGRTGRNRATDTDYAKTLIDWVFRIMRGESAEDLAKTSRYSMATIRNVLRGVSESDHWQQAHALLPMETRKEVQHALNGRLRPRDVRKIRELAANGLTQAAIGKLYDRTYSDISLIVNGKRYGHVT